jgi:hypothetical protein
MTFKTTQSTGDVMFGLAPVGGTVVSNNWNSTAFGFQLSGTGTTTRYNQTQGSTTSNTVGQTHRITISTTGTLILYINGTQVYTQSGLRPVPIACILAHGGTAKTLSNIVLRPNNAIVECTTDTDGDGIPNGLDTDSDGDGCSDAYESGATADNTPGYTFPGPYGNNGLANSVETGTESGVVNYTSTYSSYALFDNISPCMDSDNDGITDFIDLDDDNDGVPDNAECGGSAIGVTPDDWFFNGSASYASNEYTLTTASNNQTGAIWNKNRLDLREDWETNFELFLGSNDNGADGIAFVLQNKGIDPPLLSGGGLGYSGLFNSVAVEFDDFNNGTAWGDLADDHIAIHRNEVTNIAAGPVALPNFEDGAYHTAKITWKSSTKTMTVSFDGVQRLTYSEDFVSTVFSGDPVVHFGLTSATGGAVNLHKYRNLSMTVTCTSDTDGDGIPNVLDTDSDGDGCSDAFESGATTNLAANYTFPGLMVPMVWPTAWKPHRSRV